MGTYLRSTLIHTTDFVLLIPCLNVASSIGALLSRLETSLRPIDHRFLLLLVDNASEDDTLAQLRGHLFNAANVAIEIISLPSRLDSEKAIAEGLAIAARVSCDRFILIDGNGSDDPQAIPQLIGEKQQDVVFIDKGPRSGNLLYWLVFRFYQVFFRFFTGREIQVGHYSMINRKALLALLRRPFFHYTAAICRKPLKMKKIRYEHRLQNFRQEYQLLFRNGVKSFLEFGEDILNAFLKLSLGLGFLLFAGILCALYFRFGTDLNLPGWTIFALIGLFNGLVLSIGIFAIGVVLLNKNSPPEQLLPQQDLQLLRKEEISVPMHDPISLN